ncbi:MAG: hypothetical protein U0805_11300 [Pirellulales bacterium]
MSLPSGVNGRLDFLRCREAAASTAFCIRVSVSTTRPVSTESGQEREQHSEQKARQDNDNAALPRWRRTVLSKSLLLFFMVHTPDRRDQ